MSLGLGELVTAAKPGECPFCGDPVAKKRTKPHLTCGEPECKTAYFRYWQRDVRKALRVVRESILELEKLLG